MMSRPSVVASPAGYNLLSAAPRFGSSREDASAVIDEILDVVESGWRSAIMDHRGSEDDCQAVSGAFVYEGFDQRETEALPPTRHAEDVDRRIHLPHVALESGELNAGGDAQLARERTQ